MSAGQGHRETGALPRASGLSPEPSRPAMTDLGPVTRQVLPNGLTVLVRETVVLRSSR